MVLMVWNVGGGGTHGLRKTVHHSRLDDFGYWKGLMWKPTCDALPRLADRVRSWCAVMIGIPLVSSVDVEESRPGFSPDKVNFDRKGVLGIFYPQKMPRPPRGVLRSYAPEGCFHLLVIPLSLAMAWWRPKQPAEHLPEPEGELWALSGHYVLELSMEPKHTKQDFLCCLVCRQGNKMCHFREPARMVAGSQGWFAPWNCWERHLVYHFGIHGGRTGLSWRGWRTGPTLPTCQRQLHSQQLLIPHIIVVISGWESWETKALGWTLLSGKRWKRTISTTTASVHLNDRLKLWVWHLLDRQGGTLEQECPEGYLSLMGPGGLGVWVDKYM